METLPVQTKIPRFVADMTKPGRVYRARIGRGRVVEIKDGRIFPPGRPGQDPRSLAWSEKRVLAFEEMDRDYRLAIEAAADRPRSILSRKRKTK